MVASAPILDDDGRLLGVLAGRLNLPTLDTIVLQRGGLYETDDAYLVNVSNLLLTQPRYLPNAAILQRGIHTEAVQRCLQQEDGTITAPDYRGVESISAYRWIANMGTCLVIDVDRAEALQPIHDFRNMILLTGAIVLAFATIVAIALASTIVRPVRHLQTGVIRFGRGESDVRLDESSSDELGDLAHEFNQMADTLSAKDAELRSHAAQLESANKELEAFSYSISHDLRAPLRAIDGFSRILLEDATDELSDDSQRYLGIVRVNVQQMGHLIDDLLAFSRLSRQPLKKQRIRPINLVRDALDDLQTEQDGRQVEFILGDMPACNGDPALLKQVYVNLLSNSLKFTSTREVAKIEVGYEDSAYFVRDNGVGFDMKYGEKLFGVFQRLHRSEEYEGTGVGLAIVQRIISRHGGRVWAESTLDQGATFYFTVRGEKT